MQKLEAPQGLEENIKHEPLKTDRIQDASEKEATSPNLSIVGERR